MGRKNQGTTIEVSKQVDIDVEVQVDINDVIGWIEEAEDSELKEVVKYIKAAASAIAFPDTVYDKLKVEVLEEAMNKYTLEELQKRLA